MADVPGALEEAARRVQPLVPASERTLPVLSLLAELLPDRGLRRGSTVAVHGGTGATSLALALLAGPTSAGSWAAVVGVPDLGVLAASELGVDLGRLAVVPSPGERWASVAAALLASLDLVVVRPPAPPRAGDARRLLARARHGGAVLVALGPWPDGPDLRLEIVSAHWSGTGDGSGRLTGRRVELDVHARRSGAARRAQLWLPGPTGALAAMEGEGLHGEPGIHGRPGAVALVAAPA